MYHQIIFIVTIDINITVGSTTLINSFSGTNTYSFFSFQYIYIFIYIPFFFVALIFNQYTSIRDYIERC